MTPWRASWPHVPDAQRHRDFPAPDCSWTVGEERTTRYVIFWNPVSNNNSQKCPHSSYHDGVDKSHDVYGPDGAEAGQHGQEEVVFNFGPVQGWVGSDAGVARKWRPRREGGVTDGACPTPLPGLSVMGVGNGVLSSGRRGDDWGGAVRRCCVDPITYTWGTKRTGRGWADSAAVIPLRPFKIRSNSVTYCSSASRWWLWQALLWICCVAALCLLGFRCCRGPVVHPW